MKERIRQIMVESIVVKEKMLADPGMIGLLEKIVELCVQVFERGGKILFCGNGGSAADAQHLAAEFSGRFYKNRSALFAEALHVNSSFVTAVANDFGYDSVFARMVEAAGKPGDLLFAISTSGNSPSILNAAEKAKNIGLFVVGLTGQTGGKLSEKCDYTLKVPSNDTPRIQESHIMLGHIVCELTEAKLFP